MTGPPPRRRARERALGRARTWVRRVRRATGRGGSEAREVVVVAPVGDGRLSVSARGSASRLVDPAADGAAVQVGGQLELRVPDVGGLLHVATSGVLAGAVTAACVRLDRCPREHRSGVRLPRLRRDSEEVSWRREGDGAVLQLRWSAPQEVPRVLDDLCRALVRASWWDQASGPLVAADRAAGRAGSAAWPAAHLVGAAAPGTAEEPLPLSTAGELGLVPDGLPTLVSAVANPHGRALVGPPPELVVSAPAGAAAGGLEVRDAHGRRVLVLDGSSAPESALLAATSGPDPVLPKYAVADVTTLPTTPAARHALLALSACGVVLRSGDGAVLAGLRELGLTAVDQAERDELEWYRLSATAARRAAVLGDPVLRRTRLADRGPGVTPGPGLPLPGVSVLLSSRRPDDLLRLLPRLGDQTYPALEVLVATHGFVLPEHVRAGLTDSVRLPLRIVEVAADVPFGEVLGRLSRLADGELLTKVDDDDRYGREHVTDLVVGWRTSGADLVGKGVRFTYLPDRDTTVDRRWAAPEVDDVYVAGGTLLLPRRTLVEAGGWSRAPRHVDTHLVHRLRHRGGVVHRLHSLDYAYVRRDSGHTWQTDLAALAAQGEAAYPGLPSPVVQE